MRANARWKDVRAYGVEFPRFSGHFDLPLS
jgi:hypothetical protein